MKGSLRRVKNRVLECILTKMEASTKETSQMIVDKVQDKLSILQDKALKVNLQMIYWKKAFLLKKVGILLATLKIVNLMGFVQ